MGKLIYDGDVSVTFDDRLLAHLAIVIGAKLRRNEPFYFTWKDDVRSGDGRTTVWLHPAVALRFKYAGSVNVQLNRAWIEALTRSANSTGGLVIVPEPEEVTA
ncbi:DUF7882 family protein [Microcella flavibacter]|uniref:DUF7882 family protein n=1 Tax=Microcella flavibacter TaxID=1804990 RepID=UPI00145698E1|nr:ATP-dependent DNA ligase [Microcella flavibacter]